VIKILLDVLDQTILEILNVQLCLTILRIVPNSLSQESEDWFRGLVSQTSF